MENRAVPGCLSQREFFADVAWRGSGEGSHADPAGLCPHARAAAPKMYGEEGLWAFYKAWRRSGCARSPTP